MADATPMTPMHIEVLLGPEAGRRLAAPGPQVTLGRDLGNGVIVPLPFISRQHCELRFEEGQWWLANLSPNGTWLNRKRVGKKPLPVRSGDTIVIGEQPVVRLVLGAAPTPAEREALETEQTVRPAAPAKASMGRRARIWVYIGIYILALAAITLVLMSIFAKGGGAGTAIEAPYTPARIHEAVLRPVPARERDERRAVEQLQNAGVFFQKLRPGDNTASMYRSYRAYRESLAFSGKTAFDDPLDQRRYQEVETRLLASVLSLYQRAYAALQARQYREARDAFQQLSVMFPDTGSAFYDHVQRLQAQANKMLTAGKNKGLL